MVQTKHLPEYHLYDEQWDSWEEINETFEWNVPDNFNMAAYTCDRWAGEERVAIHFQDQSGNTEQYTYQELADTTDRLATYLSEQGINKGDRIGVYTPQRPETLMTHLAAWKLGAVSVPLSTLFGDEALRYRLADSETVACVADASSMETLRSVQPELEHLDLMLNVDAQTTHREEHGFWDAIEGTAQRFDCISTDAEDDGVILYTSGTTGDPKGVRHAHRVLLGMLPFFVTSFCNLDLIEREVAWTPVEWSWVGSLYSAVMPTLFFGKSVVAYNRDSFDPEAAFEVIDQHDVSIYLGPPTTLRMMMNQVKNPANKFDLSRVRVILSGGESVDPGVKTWAESTFENAILNEAWGQTEANAAIGECAAMFDPVDGSMGRPLPGHNVTIVDTDSAEPLETTNNVGEIAIEYERNPVCMKEYLNMPEATANKIQNGWLLTEDLGEMDKDHNIYYEARKDDVIISSGYRISPKEIEESLNEHESTATVGVVGIPDEERGEIPKAFVVLKPEYEPSSGVKADIQAFVKEHLAKYEYPREIEFMEELPKTSTGKVKREDLKELE
jgi:acetyl-CoA synthetase